ncbi:family 16 glycosylhydrolase [Lutibacter citreus]|uniref:family 16 glycosylhydrolase n=1 Tax=Lutibacter citreus TaxID=2138210 RepID=UPI000DBDFFA4|nr:family 16 glycosylhydrolase [Lutibacter citreus]
MSVKYIFFSLISVFFILKTQAQEKKQIDYSNWKLVWNDEFDYKDEILDKEWISANHPSKSLYCSRWRENAVVKNGVLHLENRKEKRGGQDWTSGSVWTRKKFKYGYFECRYKYAGAEATNNSFWLMTQGPEPKEGKRFEIDINEGHFPNEVSTNIHQWSDFTIDKNGKKRHKVNHKVFSFGTKPDYSIQLETPVKTKKIRLVSKSQSKFHIKEFRIYGVNKSGNYPKVLSKTADNDIESLTNYARAKDVVIKSSGSYKNNNSENLLADGSLNTSWITQNKGEKWIEFEWKENRTIGCVQFINGWNDAKGNWHNLVSDYKVQFLEEGVWKDIAVLDVEKSYNFADEYHTYGLEWNEQELIFYFDGKEIRREENTFCHSETPIWLSLAIIKWSGTVTDAIDGTSMKVDYVRYYNKKQ